MVRILLADDHPVVREGLKRILATAFHSVVFGEAENGQRVLDLISRERWDVLVLELSMAVKGALDILKESSGRRGSPPVLILSAQHETFYAVQAFRRGAAGYLTKAVVPEELVAAVKKLLAGGRYIPPDLAENVVSELGSGETPLYNLLTAREFEVLKSILRGKKLNEIARELSLSPRTVSTHRARILEKLQLKSNAELVAYALQHGLGPNG